MAKATGNNNQQSVVSGQEHSGTTELEIVNSKIGIVDIPPVFTIEELKKEFGSKKGEEIYHEIAIAGGFGDFRNAGEFYGGHPPLATVGIDADTKEMREIRTRLEQILIDARKDDK